MGCGGGGGREGVVYGSYYPTGFPAVNQRLIKDYSYLAPSEQHMPGSCTRCCAENLQIATKNKSFPIREFLMTNHLVIE